LLAELGVHYPELSARVLGDCIALAHAEAPTVRGTPPGQSIRMLACARLDVARARTRIAAGRVHRPSGAGRGLEPFLMLNQ
jgi:hypothetical protein